MVNWKPWLLLWMPCWPNSTPPVYIFLPVNRCREWRHCRKFLWYRHWIHHLNDTPERGKCWKMDPAAKAGSRWATGCWKPTAIPLPGKDQYRFHQGSAQGRTRNTGEIELLRGTQVKKIPVTRIWYRWAAWMHLIWSIVLRIYQAE